MNFCYKSVEIGNDDVIRYIASYLRFTDDKESTDNFNNCFKKEKSSLYFEFDDKIWSGISRLQTYINCQDDNIDSQRIKMSKWSYDISKRLCNMIENESINQHVNNWVIGDRHEN